MEPQRRRMPLHPIPIRVPHRETRDAIMYCLLTLLALN